MRAKVRKFVDEEIIPKEPLFVQQLNEGGGNRWKVIPLMEELKAKAKVKNSFPIELIRNINRYIERHKDYGISSCRRIHLRLVPG